MMLRVRSISFTVAPYASNVGFHGQSKNSPLRALPLPGEERGKLANSSVRNLFHGGVDSGFGAVVSADSYGTQHGVPPALQSCHTSLVNGYVIEGHVPVGAIRRLVSEGKQIKGIAVPGMPAGSPGMGPMKPGTLTIYETRKVRRDASGLLDRVIAAVQNELRNG